jgi:phasin family protein
MSTFPEQFSAAGKSQVAAQLAFFQNATASAVEGAEKIIALNLSTARASLEKSRNAVQQILAAQDPRDLLSLTTQSQETFDTLLAYGRELFTIATGTQAAILNKTAAAPQAASAPQAPPALVAPADPFPVAARVKPVVRAAAKVAEAAAPEPVAADIDDLEADLAEEQLELLVAKPRRKK